MFDKVKKNGTEQLGKTNRIVEGTSIIGDIVSKADFRLDGELIGNFTSQGKLVIGASGVIKGEIICNNADIEGEFHHCWYELPDGTRHRMTPAELGNHSLLPAGARVYRLKSLEPSAV